MIWIISDQHFNHKNIINLCDRPFSDVDNMNDQLIKNFNYWVKKDDITYHLGDFALGKKEQIKEFIKALNGRHFIILGNHDRYKTTEYINLGFEWASRFPIIFNKFYILSHEPIYLEGNSVYVNLHGHTHKNDYDSLMPNYYNCCVERHEYLPISFDNIIKHFRYLGFDEGKLKTN
jgi:calcineurin-like phosphoesterase family protein